MAAEDASRFPAQRGRFPLVNESRAQKAIADCRLIDCRFMIVD